MARRRRFFIHSFTHSLIHKKKRSLEEECARIIINIIFDIVIIMTSISSPSVSSQSRFLHLCLLQTTPQQQRRQSRRQSLPFAVVSDDATSPGEEEGVGRGGGFRNSKAFEALREAQKLRDVVKEEEEEEKKKTKKKPKNPFEETTRRKPSTSSSSSSSSKTFSLVKKSVDVSKLPSLRDADVVLRRFDDEQRKRVSSSSSSSTTTTTTCAERSLSNAVRTLSYNSETVMFGICAQTGREGIDALKIWTEELNLPKGKLHGLDTDGIPKPIPSEAVFIKYNSLSGDAFCSEYHGEFRGVLFTPVLNDGVFRQFGYLDLSLFDDNNDADVRF
jgi:hypothetical protein